MDIHLVRVPQDVDAVNVRWNPAKWGERPAFLSVHVDNYGCFPALGQHDCQTRFFQATWSSGSLHISLNLSPVQLIPLHRPETVLLAFLVIFSPKLYSARWCLPGFISLSPLTRVHTIWAASSAPYTSQCAYIRIGLKKCIRLTIIQGMTWISRVLRMETPNTEEWEGRYRTAT